MKSFFRYWLPVIFWMGIIFWMSTDALSSQNTSSIVGLFFQFWTPDISNKTMDMIHGLIRKGGHVAEYFILGLLLFRAFRGDSGKTQARQWVGSSIIIIVLYAAGDELHQSFVASRTASLVDVGIDTIGGVLAQTTSIVWHSYKGK